MKVCLFLLFIASCLPLAAKDLYCLGRIELAGMPPDALPRLGESLHLSPETLQLYRADGTLAGFVPAPFRTPILTMASRGVELQFEVVLLHASPRPGRYVMVEVWAVPNSSEDLEYLVYKVSNHEQIPNDS